MLCPVTNTYQMLSKSQLSCFVQTDIRVSHQQMLKWYMHWEEEGDLIQHPLQTVTDFREYLSRAQKNTCKYMKCLDLCVMKLENCLLLNATGKREVKAKNGREYFLFNITSPFSLTAHNSVDLFSVRHVSKLLLYCMLLYQLMM